MGFISELLAEIIGYFSTMLGLFTDSARIRIVIIILAGIGGAAGAYRASPNYLKKPLSILTAAVIIITGLLLHLKPWVHIGNGGTDPVDPSGNLQVAFNIMELEVKNDENGEGIFTEPKGKLNIETVILTRLNDNTDCTFNSFENNILEYEHLMAGSYKLSVKFQNFYQCTKNFDLLPEDITNGNWMKQTISIKREDSVENVPIQFVYENEDVPPDDTVVDIYIEGSDEKIENISVGKGGKIQIICCKGAALVIEATNNGKKKIWNVVMNDNAISNMDNTTKNSNHSGNNSNTKSNNNTNNSNTGNNNNINQNNYINNNSNADNTNLFQGDTQDPGSSVTDDNETKDNDTENVIFKDNTVYLLFYDSVTDEPDWREKIDEEEAQREKIQKDYNPRNILTNREPASLNLENFAVSGCQDGLLDYDNPQNSYTVELEADSYWLELEQDYPAEDDESAWYLTVIDEDGAIRMEFTAERRLEKSISDIIELETGTYYIYVEAANGDGVYDTGYTLNLKQLNSLQPMEEEEQHDDPQNNTGAFYYGNIEQPDDIDCFFVQPDSDAVIAFKFEHEELEDDNIIWEINLKNESDNIIKKVPVKGGDPITISSNIGLPSGTYTIEIKGGKEYYCRGIYAFSTVCCTSEDWEKEPNNSPDTMEPDLYETTSDEDVSNPGDADYAAVADSDDPDHTGYDTVADADDLDDVDYDSVSDFGNIEADFSYADKLKHGVGINASLSGSNDTDNFKFVCPESGSYDLICKHPETNTSSGGLRISIYDSTGNLIDEYQFYSDWQSAETIDNVELTKDNVYYIRIESYESWTDSDYLLRIVRNEDVSAASVM